MFAAAHFGSEIGLSPKVMRRSPESLHLGCRMHRHCMGAAICLGGLARREVGRSCVSKLAAACMEKPVDGGTKVECTKHRVAVRACNLDMDQRHLHWPTSQRRVTGGTDLVSPRAKRCSRHQIFGKATSQNAMLPVRSLVTAIPTRLTYVLSLLG